MQSSEENDLVWLVDTPEAGQRIDKFLTDALDDEASRSQIQQWIKQGNIGVNNKPIKANYKLLEGDQIHLIIPEPETTELIPENIALDVVYEDSDVVVVNKPRGMVVHPAVGHPSGTLVNALMHHCKELPDLNGEIRAGIVHRIDKDTSGLLMVAKTDRAYTALSQQLKEHTVIRKYWAVVHGIVTHQLGTVDAPIGRDTRERKTFVVKENNSKHAVTHFTMLEQFKQCTLLELKLETGRTHQIRVHMKFIGHPLVGDPVYGRSKGISMKGGQALHAAVLGFKHPITGEYLEFEAPIPEDMNELLSILRNQ